MMLGSALLVVWPGRPEWLFWFAAGIGLGSVVNSWAYHLLRRRSLAAPFKVSHWTGVILLLGGVLTQSLAMSMAAMGWLLAGQVWVWTDARNRTPKPPSG